MLDIHSTAKLNSGYEMPMLGFGVFEIDDGSVCERSVRDALAAGYRHVDTAAIYGNEASVGRALAASGVPRDEVFVTTKVWIGDFGRDATRKACEESLRRLGTDYVDLYLIHWPIDETMMGAWDAMQALRDEGKCRSIGVSNFSIRRFEESFFRRTEEVPAVNQVEFHPFWNRTELLAYCRERGTQLEGYSPLARAERMDDATLQDLAAAYGKSPAQILIRWQLQQDLVVIPKSSRSERIGQNADVFDFEISPEDMARLDSLNEDKPVPTWRPHEDWY
jgi:diketogulonate reductase-like aldo/keto reductase